MDFGRERPQAERGGGQAPAWACPPLPTCKRGDGRRSRPGASLLVSALTDARRSATSGHFVPALRGTKDGGRGLIYLPPLSENERAFCSLPVTKTPPVSLPVQAECIPHRTPLPPSATPAGITHYTLQARSCAKGVPLPPFGNPRFCRSVATVRNPAPVSPPLQNAKKRRRPAQPHGLICAASLFGLRAGTGVLRGLLKCKICVLIMVFWC